MAVAMEGGDEDGKRELGELRAQHRETRSRAASLSEKLERENEALTELLKSYKQADEALERSRNHR